MDRAYGFEPERKQETGKILPTLAMLVANANQESITFLGIGRNQRLVTDDFAIPRRDEIGRPIIDDRKLMTERDQYTMAKASLTGRADDKIHMPL